MGWSLSHSQSYIGHCFTNSVGCNFTVSLVLIIVSWLARSFSLFCQKFMCWSRVQVNLCRSLFHRRPCFGYFYGQSSVGHCFMVSSRVGHCSIVSSRVGHYFMVCSRVDQCFMVSSRVDHYFMVCSRVGQCFM